MQFSGDAARLGGANGVRSRGFIDRQAVVDVAPIVGRGISRIDVERLDSIDQLQHPFDLWPTGQSQENLPAWIDPGDRRIALPRCRGAQDVDTGLDRSKVVGCPAYEGKDAAWGKGQNAAAAIHDLLGNRTAEPHAVLNALFEPQDLNRREVFSHDVSPCCC
jgi:hypothetical protein